MEQYLKQGLVSDSKVLDIRQVDVGLSYSMVLSTELDYHATGLYGQNT